MLTGEAQQIKSFLPQPLLERTNIANGHKYVVLSPATWTASEQKAIELGGHLATISDEDENKWLASTFREFRSLWIGLNDRTERFRFSWISGERSTFTNWRKASRTTSGPQALRMLARRQ